jgi:hypothetical protein
MGIRLLTSAATSFRKGFEIASLVCFTVGLGLQPMARSAETQTRQEAKTEERMKDEKKRDEQSAKDHAGRASPASIPFGARQEIRTWMFFRP